MPGKPNNRIRLLGIFGTMTANGTLQIQEDSSGTALTGVMTITGGQPFCTGPASIENGEGILETQVAGNGLNIVTATSGFNGALQFQYIPG